MVLVLWTRGGQGWGRRRAREREKSLVRYHRAYLGDFVCHVSLLPDDVRSRRITICTPSGEMIHSAMAFKARALDLLTGIRDRRHLHNKWKRRRVALTLSLFPFLGRASQTVGCGNTELAKFKNRVTVGYGL